MITQSSLSITWEEAVQWLRKQPEQAALVESCFFDDPLIGAAERYYHSCEWRELKRYLPSPPGLVCDVGAGRGISSYAFAREGWQVASLEPDNSSIVGAGAIRELKQQTKLSIQVYQARGEEIPFEGATFDVVYARQVLHHACDLDRLCDEMARVLKEGGYFIATREHVLSQSKDLDIFLQNHPLHRFYGGEYAYTLSEYIEAIENAGIDFTHILNPYESDLNLYPGSKTQLKQCIAEKLCFPFPNKIPDFILTHLGRHISTPGRLYSFIGRKQHGH